MNQQIETVIKALLVIAGLVFGSGAVVLFDSVLVSQTSGVIAALGAIFVDQWSTYRLQKQGIVSTDPVANVAAPGSPQKLAREESDA